MDAQYSTLRNLLWFVLVLVALAVLSNFYVASQLSRNSDELASIRMLLQKDMLGNALTQSEELQKRMDALNASANGMDEKMKKAQDEMEAKLRKAQDDFVARMKTEMPRIMDSYIQSRAPRIQQGAEQELRKRGVPVN
jgi:TolA-binding protein